MQSTLTTKSLDIETTVITNPKLNKNKQLSAAIINSKTRSALYIETPYLINPFGLSSYDGGKGIQEDAKSWSIALKAQGNQSENPEDVSTLFSFLKALDEKTIDYGLVNSQTIFKKKYDEGQRSILVDLLYNRCVKPSVSADGTVYPDKISLKVSKQSNMLPDILVFKDSNTPLLIDSWEALQEVIPKGSPIKAIIQPKIYFVNGKFGINFRVLQIKLPNIEKVGRPLTYAFSDAPTEESSVKLIPDVIPPVEEAVTTATPTPPTPPTAEVSSPVVASSTTEDAQAEDSEEEEESDEEEVNGDD